MIFDTDVFVWAQRGNLKAIQIMEAEEDRRLSILTYMELLQGATDKRQHHNTLAFLSEFGFRVLPLTENIGHRAAVYIEEYSLSHGLRAADAIIAATASENGLVLCSSNARHFRPIKELRLQLFRP